MDRPPWQPAGTLLPAASNPFCGAVRGHWCGPGGGILEPCFTTSGGTEPLELALNGTWSTSLTFGASGLPVGASSSDMILDENLTNDVWSTATPPIPPGWSNGTGPLAVGPETIAEAYADTTIPVGLEAGSTLTITIWASDGTTKQTESVPIVIKASCVRHY
jgi:hypothetical protein